MYTNFSERICLFCTCFKDGRVSGTLYRKRFTIVYMAKIWKCMKFRTINFAIHAVVVAVLNFGYVIAMSQIRLSIHIYINKNLFIH